MYIISYGEPSIFQGGLDSETLMAGRRRCDDCDDCDGICYDNDGEDCDPIFCGYDGGYHDDDDMVCTCNFVD